MLLVVGLIAWSVEIFAVQAPSSSWRLHALPGPIEDLGAFELRLSFAIALLALLHDRGVKLSRFSTPLLIAGTLITTAAYLYAAATGVVGIQIEDPRPRVLVLFFARSFGELLLLGVVGDFLRAVFARDDNA